MRTKAAVVLALTLTLILGSTLGNAHSLTTGLCNAMLSQGEPLLNIVVQPNGAISGTGGASHSPFTAQVQPNGTVNLYRPDGTLWYEGAQMKDGWFFAKYHQPATNGGRVLDAKIPCSAR